MTTISAQTILRSRHTQQPDKVLSALLLTYPRWIHAEQRTHRVVPLEEGWDFLEATPSLMADPSLSRNASSSRAIPVEKLLMDVLGDPAVPVFWGKNQKGMQAGEELSGTALTVSKDLWYEAMENAVRLARALAAQGAHKQIVNRILEPFSHIRVVASATEWSNFLGVRDHADAEPHIAMLAREIRRELEREDNIQDLAPGEWHTPFVDWDGPEFDQSLARTKNLAETTKEMIKLSVARCASTSFKTVDGFDMTLDRAVALHDKLVSSQPLHASPAEHVAQADEMCVNADVWAASGLHGNFVGFKQYRRMLLGGKGFDEEPMENA